MPSRRLNPNLDYSRLHGIARGIVQDNTYTRKRHHQGRETDLFRRHFTTSSDRVLANVTHLESRKISPISIDRFLCLFGDYSSFGFRTVLLQDACIQARRGQTPTALNGCSLGRGGNRRAVSRLSFRIFTTLSELLE